MQARLEARAFACALSAFVVDAIRVLVAVLCNVARLVAVVADKCNASVAHRPWLLLWLGWTSRLVVLAQQRH